LLSDVEAEPIIVVVIIIISLCRSVKCIFRRFVLISVIVTEASTISDYVSRTGDLPL